MQCLASSVPDNFALCTRFEPRLHPGHKPHFPRVLNPTVCDRFELRLKRQNTKRQKGKKTKRQKDKKTKRQKDKRTKRQKDKNTKRQKSGHIPLNLRYILLRIPNTTIRDRLVRLVRLKRQK